MGGLLQPGLEVLGRLEREPLLARAAEHRALVPGLVLVDRGVAFGEPGLVELARHAARHHVGRVRPRAAEGDDDREDPLRVLDGLARQPALEGRREELDDAVVERVPGVGGVAEVGREHEKAVARVAHDGLGHEAEVADAGPVGGDRLPVGGLERRGRRIELRRAADPADARRDDQRVGGIAPARICSKPRNIVPTHHASVTVWPSSSSLTSMSPSTRLSSIRMTRRSVAMLSRLNRGAQALAEGRDAMLEERLGQRELRADASVARVADLVHRAAALLARIRQARLLHRRAPDAIEPEVAAAQDRAHGLDHRRGVHGAGAEVDDGQAAGRAPLRIEQAAGLAVRVLQTGGLRGIRRGRRDPTEACAAAHGQHVLRPLAQRGDDVALGPALEHVEAARAVRAVDDAALDAEQRQRLLARDDAVDDRRSLARRLERERRVPEQPGAVVLEERGQRVAGPAATLGAEDGHGLAAARPAFHPQDRRLVARRAVGVGSYCLDAEPPGFFPRCRPCRLARVRIAVAAILLPKHSPLALSGAAARVAEGGAEAVPFVRLGREDNAIAQLRGAGFALAATLVRGGADLFAAALPARLVYVLGAEAEGMDADLARTCDLRLSIPGSGAVESLNVAAATAVLLATWRNRR